MAKTSVLGTPSHSAHLSKRGFDMSQRFKFTSSVGQLLPVFSDFLNIGEKVKVSSDLFTRTQPLQTAAMLDVDEYVEWFFVPMNRFITTWNEVYSGVNDFSSAVLQGDLFNGTIFPLMRTDLLNNVPDRTTFNMYFPGFTDYSVYGSRFGTFWQDCVRLLDCLGWNIMSIMNSFTPTDNPDDFLQIDEDADYCPAVNICSLLAYQAIYMDYYRLSNWEPNCVASYNVDSAYNNDYKNPSIWLCPQYLTSNAVNKNNLKQLFSLRYRPYRRDYFNAIQPSPLINTMGMLNSYFGNGSVLYPNSFGTSTSVFNKDGGVLPTDPNNAGVTVVGKSTNFSDDEFVNAASIRSLFAVDKMMRITGMSGKHYDDQMLAHFGFQPPQGISREVYFIGRNHQKLRIGEVISTADTDNAPLAKIAGKGYSTTSKLKSFTFTAPCHGILMAIYSSVPDNDYVLSLDKQLTAVNRYDVYQPELDNLGMQPLFGYEEFPGTNYVSSILGWQPRYMQYKTKPNRASHAFLDMNLAAGEGNLHSGSFMSWSFSTLPFRGMVFGNQESGSKQFLCSPHDLDSVMLVAYKGDYGASSLFGDASWISKVYSTDPFIHNLQLNVYKVSPMTTFGIEEL